MGGLAAASRDHRNGLSPWQHGRRELRMDLARSAATLDTDDGSVADIQDWLAEAAPAHASTELVPLRDLRDWVLDACGNLRHASGRFFAVEGLRVTSDGTAAGGNAWDQPILDQPEIGILGLLCQRRRGILSFLVQAKAEPGNVGGVQVSPTLQATWSNYHRVHGGRTPPYLEHFLKPSGRVHVDLLQPEQGSRFLHKHNRNVVIEVPPDRHVPIRDHFRWVTLGQLRAMLARANVVNAECRSVLACLPDPSEERETPPCSSEIATWLGAAAERQALSTERCDVRELRGWAVDEWSIAAPAGPFRVVGIRATMMGREVRSWDQPLVQPIRTGIVGFLSRVEHGVQQLLVQARMEAGAARPTLGPTVQTSDPEAPENRARPAYLGWFLPTAAGVERYRALQSEEGGRFLREQHMHVVVDVGRATVPLEDSYRWLPVDDVRALVRQGHVSSQARSLLACLSAA
jgi:oxidase EvaA